MKITAAPLADEQAFLRDWTGLHARAGNATPFQSPAWMQVWLAAARERAPLYVVRGEAEDLSALAVFGLAQRRMKGSVARLYETDDETLDDVYVEYNDVLLAHDAPSEARRLVLAGLLAGLPAQEIVLRNVPPPMRQAALAAGREAGWIVRVALENPCYGRHLGTPAPVSRNTRQQVARSKRLYEARGPLRLEVADTPQARRAAYPILADLHRTVWSARGKGGVFDRPGIAAFHEALLAREDAPVEIVVLTCGGEPVGALHMLIGEGTAHQYQSGFALEADNRLKPGLLTHSLAMEHYKARGLAVYDMMAGEARYKQSLGEPLRRLSTIEMQRPGWRQKLRGVARNFR